jgi:hypothetical protein
LSCSVGTIINLTAIDKGRIQQVRVKYKGGKSQPIGLVQEIALIILLQSANSLPRRYCREFADNG